MNPIDRKYFIRLAGIVFITALGSRLIFFSVVLRHPERAFYGDSAGYLTLGRNLFNGNGFSSFEDPPFLPNAERTPLYPAFLAAASLIAGERPEPVILIQNILDAASALMIFLIGTLLAGSPAGLLAAGLYVLNPVALIQNQFILSETLFVFLFLAGLLSLTYANARRSIRCAASGVLLWSLATYVRPTGGWFMLVLACAILVLEWRRGWKRAVLLCLASAGLFLILLSPWYIRNALAFNKFFLSTNTEYAFLTAHAYPVLSRAENKTPEQAHREVTFRVMDELRRNGLNPPPRYIATVPGTGFPTETDPGVSKLFLREGLKDLARYRRIHALGLAENITRLALWPESGRSEHITSLLGLAEIPIRPLRKELQELMAGKQWVKVPGLFWEARIKPLPWTGKALWWWIAVFEGPVFIAALLGVLMACRSAEPAPLKLFSLLFLLTILYFLAAPGLGIEPRYRFPADPLICLCAGLLCGGFMFKKTQSL